MDMSDESVRDLEQELRGSLHAAAPHPLPDMTDRLLARTAAIEQRRRWGGLPLVPALGAAAVVVIAVVAGVAIADLLPRTDPPGVGPSTAAVSPSPSPTVTPTPLSEPASTPTPSQTPSPSPSQSPSAAVFPGGSDCENESLGYIVSYPADWYANEAVDPDDPAFDPIAACQYFGEEPMELTPNAGLPPTVAVSFSREAEVPPPSTGATVLSDRAVTVAGQPATVRELEMSDAAAPFFRAGDRVYSYLIELPTGDYLLVSTSSTSNGDYESHTEVLDQMMETLDFIGS
jgi:hypothetical protein